MNLLFNKDRQFRMGYALRVVGSSSLILSAAIFLLQGLQAASSFDRFLSFAALTAAITAGGLFTGLRLREPRTARVFLALAAAATPVLFSQIGAMFYGLVATTPSSSIPSALIFAAPTVTSVVVSAVLATALMSPVLYIGLGSLFRSRAKLFSVLLLIGSFFLLVPGRDPASAAGLLFAHAAMMIFVVRAIRNRQTGDTESLIATTLTVVPVMILIGRQMFYDTSSIFQSLSFFWIAVFFRGILPLAIKDKTQSLLACNFGLFAAVLSWIFLTCTAIELVPAWQPLALMLACYPPTMVFLLNAKLSINQPVAILATRLGAFVIPAATMILSWTMPTAIFFVLFGLASATVTWTWQKSVAFQSSLVVTSLGALYFAAEASHHFWQMPWVSLAVLGVSVLLAAGWVEKNSSKFLNFKSVWQKHFESSEQEQA